jgi:sialic acid synthase SpsE
MNLPYLVCEVGLNHGGDFATAMEMVHEIAAVAKDYPGGMAAKFQAVKASTLCVKDSPTYFTQHGEVASTQWEFFKRSDALSQEHYEALAHACGNLGIDFGCTAFTPEDVAWIDPLVKWHKVASADITNLPLLEAIASYGKRVYLSTGAATREEVRAANNLLGNCGLTLLHCVLSYPTPPSAANLEIIETLRDWMRPVGYSDHTLFNLDVLMTAWLLGASVIEKHFTLDKTLPGNDHYHSMDPTDLRALVAKFKELQAMIGDGEKRVLPIEESARRHARRGLYAARDIPSNKVLEPADIAILRPSARLGPEQYAKVLGLPLYGDRKAGEPL